MRSSGGLWNRLLSQVPFYVLHLVTESISDTRTYFDQGIVWIAVAITFGIPAVVSSPGRFHVSR